MTLQAIIQIILGTILVFFGKWFIDLNIRYATYLFTKTGFKFYERIAKGFQASYLRYLLIVVGIFLLYKGIITLVS